MKRLTISSKIIILSLIILYVSASIVSTVTYFIAKNELNTLGNEQLTSGVHTAIGMIELLNEQVENGDTTIRGSTRKTANKIIG